MKKISSFIVFLLFLSTPAILLSQDRELFRSKFSIDQLQESPGKPLPYPQEISWDEEFIEIMGLNIEQTDLLPIPITKELTHITNENSIPLNDTHGLKLTFKSNKEITEEGYYLAISKQEISIEASTEAGNFYALQTLRQLIENKNGTVSLPVCEIKDWPAYPVRGYMIDVGRNFQSMASLKKQLDIMARYKMNVFHWHLTDRPAWRIESKRYPELTDARNHRPGRDPGKYYSYEQIRELILYAREKYIKVIPEIDMPGHSDSFVKAMGVKMESEKGMKILENVLNEFFAEIPKEDCPIIHLGSDEVKIDNPDEFISKMVGICEANDREVIIWNPGLKANDKVIRQTWQTKHLEKASFKEIDSWNNYVNNGEPMTQALRLFFKPIGFPSKNEILGGILCFWPDVNLSNEADAFRQNPVYPSLLTYAWATWTADVQQAPEAYYTILPPKGSNASDYFREFEKILLYHKTRYFTGKPFQYFLQTDKVWKLIGPFDENEGDVILQEIKGSYTYKDKALFWKNACGNTLVIKDRFKLGGHYPEAKNGQSVYALTYIHSDQAKTIEAWIGFETPLRSNRTYTGIPETGKWDASGGNIWINDKPLPAPDWKNPGWKPSKSEGWATSQDQEIPWRDEELYWTRKPAKVPLEKGWNKVFVKVPSSSDYQNWMFTFIPLKMEGLFFSTDSIHSTYYYQKKSHFESLPDTPGEIIFLGNSITDGAHWSELFENQNIKNRGISGDITTGVLARLDEVTSSKPQKIFLMIGVNDLAQGKSVEEIAGNHKKIVEKIKQDSEKTTIYLQSILPVNPEVGDRFQGHKDKTGQIIEVNTNLQKLARKHGLIYIDLYSSFINDEGYLDTRYTNDGLHLTGEGYLLWKNFIKKFIHD